MKAKHIITTCGVLLGGLAAAQSASAIVTYRGSSDIQFTFAPHLSVSLSDDTFTIDSLTPGTSDKSTAVTATVNTNSSAGYILSATVGNSTTYTSTELTSSNGRFKMIGSDATALTSGTWGYTLDDGETYGALPLYSAGSGVVLNKTTDAEGTAAEGYSGTSATAVKIGAYATDDQLPGTYNNVVNFAVLGNVAAQSVTLLKGTNVATVTLGASGTSNVYDPGTEVTISATCNSGKTFAGWNMTKDYGSIADVTSATTTYTVGTVGNTITAYCSE